MAHTRLTPEVSAAIVRRVRGGAQLYVSAGAVGVPKSTCRDWLAKGRAGEEPYAAWLAACNRARDQTEAAMSRKLLRAADEDWRAALAYLERARGSRWAESHRLKREKLKAEIAALHRAAADGSADGAVTVVVNVTDGHAPVDPHRATD